MSAHNVRLASGSATRARLLRDAGVTFDVAPPGVDEEPVKAALVSGGVAPREIADALAELKALRVSARGPGLVIGADQTLEHQGALLSKPASTDEARAQLERLRGSLHSLHAAVVVATDGVVIWRELKTARLTMRDFSPGFLDDYLDGEGEAVLEGPGGYRIEGRGAQLFARVEGDSFTIMGLPLIGLLDLLRRYGALPT